MVEFVIPHEVYVGIPHGGALGQNERKGGQNQIDLVVFGDDNVQRHASVRCPRSQKRHYVEKTKKKKHSQHKP